MFIQISGEKWKDVSLAYIILTVLLKGTSQSEENINVEIF